MSFQLKWIKKGMWRLLRRAVQATIFGKCTVVETSPKLETSIVTSDSN